MIFNYVMLISVGVSMEFLTAIEGKLKEMVETEDVIRDEQNIIGLTHSTNMVIMIVETKTRTFSQSSCSFL